MRKLKGASIFPGFVVAAAHAARPAAVEISETSKGAAAETADLDRALALSEKQIRALRDAALKRVGPKEAEIFDAHLLMLQDPEFLDNVRGEIGNGVSAGVAIRRTADLFVQVLEKATSAYLRERVLDLKDVTARLTRNLSPAAADEEIARDVILLADDLTPSETMALSAHVKGVALRAGGKTSHTAILLKSMGIPSVFGLADLDLDLGGAFAVLDAGAGELTLNADEETRADAAAQVERARKDDIELREWRGRETVLRDGAKILLCANVGRQKQLTDGLANGAEGVGLYRSEFLFMDRAQPPSEKEQLEIYRAAVQSSAGRPLTIRTLDIGGDKQIPYVKIAKEENPFLGVRGLRLCLRQPELFDPQLRALVRASESGPLDVMFPMVTSVDEVKQAFERVKPLLAARPAGAPPLRWGMMLEIPSNIFMIPEFAEHFAFFSVGTNDLTQYLTAVDRQHPELGALGDSYSPGVLRALAHLAREVKAARRELSVCGEMAGDPLLVPFLIGLGVHKLSLNSLMIARHRRMLSKTTLAACEKLAVDVLKAPDRHAVAELLRNFQKEP